jgi:hypothetical protein
MSFEGWVTTYPVTCETSPEVKLESGFCVGAIVLLRTVLNVLVRP